MSRIYDEPPMALWNPVPALRLIRSTPARTWVVAALVVVVAAVHLARRLHDPDIVLLTASQGGAQWMRAAEPTNLLAQGPGERRAAFRARIVPQGEPRRVDLTVRALRRVEVALDGTPVFDSGEDLSQWKRPRVVTLDLPEGESELTLSVENVNGPPMALASAAAIGVSSPDSWEASIDGGKHWSPAISADALPRSPPEKPSSPKPLDALMAMLPWLIPAAVVAALCGWHDPRRWLRPTRICLLLLAAWAVLIGNNLWKLPAHMGFDYDEHVQYVDYLLRHRRLPLAHEGWEMFQSPLWYLLSAPLVGMLERPAGDEQVMRVLRVIPMLCGAAQVVLCFFAARYALPGERHLQSLAVLVGGLLPVNLYMSQNVGNEPLAGVFSGLTIVLTMRYLRRPGARTDSAAAAIGGTLGLALLTKASAILLTPIVGWVVSLRRKGVRRVAVGLALCGLVCGWFYARNVIHFGRPFVSGWDPDRIAWWQEPGYRTPASFLSFGQALRDPMYAGLHGFWDALYSTLWADGFASGMITDATRPPWNYTPMAALMLLSLLPSVAIAVGMALGVLRDRCLRFAAGCVAVYLLALLDLALVLPTYSTIKASYLLGTTPALGVLFAAGVAPLTRIRWLRAAAFALVVAWAVTSYAAFFVL